MAIFLDTGDVAEIRKYHGMGIIRGVTTNPSILMKSGVTGGMEGIRKKEIEIAEMIAPYPLSVEVTTNDMDEMRKQAIEFASWADNIVVKITIHGPNGEMENLQLIKELENKYNVRVNVTAMMSAQQCFLAAMADATYVSLFCGRVNNMGYNCIEELKKLRYLLDEHKLKAKIICGSTRETLNIVEWLGAGAHIVTTQPSFLEPMIVHPYSKETVQQFLKDGEKLFR